MKSSHVGVSIAIHQTTRKNSLQTLKMGELVLKRLDKVAYLCHTLIEDTFRIDEDFQDCIRGSQIGIFFPELRVANLGEDHRSLGWIQQALLDLKHFGIHLLLNLHLNGFSGCVHVTKLSSRCLIQCLRTQYVKNKKTMQ